MSSIELNPLVRDDDEQQQRRQQQRQGEYNPLVGGGQQQQQQQAQAQAQAQAQPKKPVFNPSPYRRKKKFGFLRDNLQQRRETSQAIPTVDLDGDEVERRVDAPVEEQEEEVVVFQYDPKHAPDNPLDLLDQLEDEIQENSDGVLQKLKRKHEHSTADQKDPTLFEKFGRILLVGFCYMIIIIIFYVIMLRVFEAIFNSDELLPEGYVDGNQTGSSSSELSMLSSLLPRPKDYIDELCLPEKVVEGTNATRSYCESACKNYKGCCDISFSRNGTCYRNHVPQCYSYAKCHALYTNSFDNIAYAPAPSNLHRVCDSRSLAMNRKNCEDMCEPARCCWDTESVLLGDIPSCLDTHFEMCLDYSFCQNLKVLRKGHVHVQVASTDLDMQCVHDTPKCRRECANARCCTDSASPCYRDNFISCLSYSGCNFHSNTSSTEDEDTTKNNGPLKITIEQPYARRHVPPDRLRQACSKDAIIDDPTECEVACGVAHCCWQSNKENCFHEDPIGCLGFNPCSLLPTSDGRPDLVWNDELPGQSHMYNPNNNYNDADVQDEVERFPLRKKEVNAVCDGTIQQHENCTQACKPIHNCCDPFDINDSTCYSKNMEGCYSYSRCHVLDNKYPAPDDEVINAACSLESIQKDRSNCEAICDAVRCCWDIDNYSPCIAMNYLSCQDYSLCQNLNLKKGGGDGLTTVEVATTQLDEICTRGNSNSNQGSEDAEKCLNTCTRLAFCCTDTDSLCYRNNFLACLSHTVCPTFSIDNSVGSIFSEIEPPSTALSHEGEIDASTTLIIVDDLATNCSPDNIRRKGTVRCERLCETAKCCFETNAYNCFGADPLGCLAYMHCRILYNPATISSPDDDLIQQQQQQLIDSINHNENSSGGNNINNNDQHVILFPETKTKVDITCSDDELQINRTNCEKLCKPFTETNNCCDPYYHSMYDKKKNIVATSPGIVSIDVFSASGATSTTDNDQNQNSTNVNVTDSRSEEEEAESEVCYYDEMKGCYSYSRCHALSGRTLASPNNIYEACDVEKILQDPTECNKLCEDAHCCYDFQSFQSCLHVKFVECLDYSPCQNLRHVLEENTKNGIVTATDGEKAAAEDIENTILSVAIPTLDEECEINSDVCMFECDRAGACCNDPFSTCYRENFISCLTYSSCIHHSVTSLTKVPKIYNSVPQLDPTDYAICEHDYLNAYGTVDCEELCNNPSVSCCWKQGTEQDGNCFGNDPFACIEYIQCSILDHF